MKSLAVIGVTGLSFLVVFAGTIFAATVRRLWLEIRSGSMRPVRRRVRTSR